jgi:hypothetical protein
LPRIHCLPADSGSNEADSAVLLAQYSRDASRPPGYFEQRVHLSSLCHLTQGKRRAVTGRDMSLGGEGDMQGTLVPDTETLRVGI